jgi:formylglycine-generating enzyme required for sulfatase activity
LDRCSQPGDWLRREIETAIDEKRNIIPLFFDGFSFGSLSVAEKITGKLGALNHYNGLDIPAGYFMEAMERLHGRYLNVPLNAVIHPVSKEVLKMVTEEQITVDKTLLRKSEDFKELVKPTNENRREAPSPREKGGRADVKKRKPDLHPYSIGMGVLLVAILGFAIINPLIRNLGEQEIESTTQTSEFVIVEYTSTSTKPISTNTAKSVPSTPGPTLGIVSAMISPKDGMILLFVPAGEFRMGSEDGGSDEKPVHKVYLDSFWIDQTEVTNAMYAKCVSDGECIQPSGLTYYNDSHYSNHPVIYVSWNDAVAYCSWTDRRLPTEAEWEKAASWDELKRAKYVYPWGFEFDCKKGNFLDRISNCDVFPITSPVGSYSTGASPYGVLDMAGNVWEWVSNLYQPYPYSAMDGRERLGTSGTPECYGAEATPNGTSVLPAASRLLRRARATALDFVAPAHRSAEILNSEILKF